MRTVSGPAMKDLVEIAIDLRVLSAHAVHDADFELNRLSNPLTRVPEDKLIKLWQLISKQSDAGICGLQIAQTIKPGAKGLLASWVSQADNLAEAFEIFRKNIALMNPSEQWKVSMEGNLCRLSFEFTEAGYPVIATERSMAALIIWARTLSHHAIPIQKAFFRAEKPSHHTALSQIFGEDMRFSAKENALVFDVALLNLPINGSNEYLKSLMQSHAHEELKRLKNEASFSDQVIREIEACLRREQTPSIKSFCTRYGLSRQTLFRRLKHEQTDFQRLLDERRKASAHDYLIEMQLKPFEIGLKLGFKEVSSFYKAFKRWYGMPPKAYQMKHLQRST